MEQKYKVVFTGKIAKDVPPEDVFRRISGEFKMDIDKVRSIFKGAGSVILTAATPERAEKFAQAFSRAGAHCAVVGPQQPPPQAPAQHVAPPKPEPKRAVVPGGPAARRADVKKDAPVRRAIERVAAQAVEPAPATSVKKKRRLVPVLILTAVLLSLAAGGFYVYRVGPKRSLKLPKKIYRMVLQKLSGKEWKYPSGTPEEMAKTMSVVQLIEAWETFPVSESQTSLHSEYAKAIGLKGEAAASAIPSLAAYVTDEDLYIRQGAMAGLAGIGPEGLPHLIQALKYSGGGDPVTVRWDAAMAIGTMGPEAEGAIPALGETLRNDEENVNVKLDAAAALVRVGEPAAPAINDARCYFYDKGGLSPSEVGVLRELNVAMQQMRAYFEDCEKTREIRKKSVPELIDALKTSAFPSDRELVVRELEKRGEKKQAVDALYSLLRDRSLYSQKSGIKATLKNLGVPITYDWERNSFFRASDDKVDYVELSAETRDGAIYSSGKVYAGRGVIAGLSRPQYGAITLPTFIRYTLKVSGGSLSAPIEKDFEADKEGDNAWTDVPLATGLGPGKYMVSIFLHAQYAGRDGVGKIVNNSSFPIEVEVVGDAPPTVAVEQPKGNDPEAKSAIGAFKGLVNAAKASNMEEVKKYLPKGYAQATESRGEMAMLVGMLSKIPTTK